MNIRSVGAELYHADGRTDMTKLKVAFRNFASASNKLPVSNYTADYSSTVHYPNTVVYHLPRFVPGTYIEYFSTPPHW